jgi:site-specific recombinase
MIKLLQRKKSSDPAQGKGKAIVLPLNSSGRGLDFLVELVKKIRPGHHKNLEDAELRFKAILFQLQQDKSLLFSLRKSLLSQFMNCSLNAALTESGIVSSRGFVQELISKLKHKVLPALQQPNDFLFVISRVFYKKSDRVWVEGIDPALWKRFFELLGIEVNLTEAALTRQLNQALQILSYRMVTLAMEKEVAIRYTNFSDAIQPFLEQNRLVNLYIQKSHNISAEEKRILLINIQENLYNCRQSNQWVRAQRLEYGTSLAQTFVMVRLEEQIDRMLMIMDALDGDNMFNTDRFVEYFVTVVKNENRKNSLREFLSNNLGLLAYQIAEHKGRKGEKYISSTKKDFRLLFRSAMGGGVIVSFVAIIKNLITVVHLPIFWQGVAYGSNYAAGFVMMDETGTTLATKQPAYTASALAGSLDLQKHGGRPDLKNLVITIARVSRSQIASFAGNLIIVFPLTYLLAWAFHHITGFKIAEGAAATKLLADQHPFHSLALLYACFTGFFLFLSGLIAGYVDNHVVYGRISERLKNHPIFTNTMSPKRLNRLVSMVDKSSGALAGSICLGFFLGCAGPLGKFLGIPFDIRHITISAGNTAIGFYGLDHQVATGYLLIVLAGVLMIGLLNFLVSFSLAFYVAVKSRGIHLRDYPEFLSLLGKYFRRHPKDFIWPPAAPRTAMELWPSGAHSLPSEESNNISE